MARYVTLRLLIEVADGDDDDCTQDALDIAGRACELSIGIEDVLRTDGIIEVEIAVSNCGERP